MLFADRLEIWNPGSLPSSLTVERLRKAHGSVPHNPLLAEPLYLTKYIERMGSGTIDMIRRCREAGLLEPEFAVKDGFVTTIPRRALKGSDSALAGQVTGEVTRLLLICKGEMPRRDLQEALSLKSEENFRRLYLVPALEAGLVEMSIPEKPKSRMQKYRLTAKGRQMVEKLRT